MTDFKQWLGSATIILTVVGYAPYFCDLALRRTKPHVFSWVIWGLLTGIAFCAQYAGGGGPGSWVTGFTAFCCCVIAAVAVQRGEKNITRLDWVTFIAGLAAVPAWFLTDDALTAVLIVTGIDLLAYVPTFRKSYNKPNEETVSAYAVSAVKFAISLLALDTVSLVTAIYPVSLVLSNIAFVAMVIVRRRILGADANVVDR